MFPDPDQCQQDAGTLEDGKHARDQSLDLFSWSTPGTALPPPLPRLTQAPYPVPCRPTPPHTNTSPHIPHIPTQKHPPRTLPLTHHPDTYQHMPQWQHTHMYHVFTDTHTPRSIHKRTWSFPISMQTTTPHTYIQVGAGQLGRRRSHRC